MAASFPPFPTPSVSHRRRFWAAAVLGVALGWGALPVSGVQAQALPQPEPPVKLDQARPAGDKPVNPNLNVDQAIAISQAAIGRQVGDYSFRDTNGRWIKLSDFRGKPLVISMIYSACADVCPIITSTLADADEIGRDALGDDAYNIVTIGFDIKSDNPVRMKSFASKLRVPLSEHWQFLSGDFGSIAGLSEDIGFLYYESAKGFDHLTQTTILDADGKVYRHIYGENFETPHFVNPLKDLVFGTTTPYASWEDLIKKVRLFCTIYDPAADRYRFEYAIFFRLIVGAVIILSMITFLVRWFWQNRKRNRGAA